MSDDPVLFCTMSAIAFALIGALAVMVDTFAGVASLVIAVVLLVLAVSICVSESRRKGQR